MILERELITAETAPFLGACNQMPVKRTPVWLMRQAGRYMEEYRTLRLKYGILEIIKTPELACEVTMQPINAFDLDAAIIFADILPPLEGMGLDLEFIKGEGPVIHNPIRRAADVHALTLPDPDSWHLLMDKLSQLIGDYMVAQVEAGAHVIQMFDSWVGSLSPSDYAEHVLPYSRRAIQQVKATGVPVIHFGTKTNGMLALIRDGGSDVVGVDWGIELNEAAQRLGPDVTIQGNLDPIALMAPWPELKKRAQHVLDQSKVMPNSYIFNLGHGILPKTPVDNVKRLVDFVHEYTHE